MDPRAPLPDRRRRRRARALALAVGLLGPPLLLELGLRVAGYEYRALERPVLVWNAQRDAGMRDGSDVHEPHPATLWRPRAGGAVPTVENERLNALGMRGPLPPSGPSAGRSVAFLGDSSTFGWQVPFAESYPGRLAADLGPDATVLPAGVIGFTLVQGRGRYRELLRPLGPEVVVLAFGAVNEHFPCDVGGDQERIAILERRAAAAARPGARLWRELRLVQALEALRERAAGGREQAITAWSAERLRYDAAFERRGELDFDGARRVAVDEFGALLTDFVGELRADGVTPIVVAMPREREFEARMPILREYDRELARAAESLGLAFLDARALFRGDQRGDGALLLDTVHPTPAGHRLLAEALLPLVEAAFGGGDFGPGASALSGDAGRE